jgi:uncharacterized SAM-binding protein YcdF (DUF218 family)
MIVPEMEGIILVLGAPNDETGELSTIARARCQQAIKEYRHHPGYKILLTGGYGEHFNTTEYPHTYYTKRYLISRQIPEQDILSEFVESSNTLEDARLSQPIVERYGVKQVVVVTSDFHLDRAKYVFLQTFKNMHLSFSGSHTELPQQELEALRQHEQKALRKLRKKLLVH